MRVALINSATTYHLAGQSGVAENVHSSAGDLRITATIQKQIDLRLRSTAGIPRDRGNILTTITFTTSRIFATPELADLYAADYDSTIPRTGTLHLTTNDSTPASRYLPNVVIDPPTRQIIGCTVLFQYTATGGAIQSTAP